MEYYAARFFKNQDLAQDVVQETFLIAQAKIEQVMESPSPKGWLFNTLKNVIGNTYKQQKRLANMIPIEDCELPTDMEISDETTIYLSLNEVTNHETIPFCLSCNCYSVFDVCASRFCR